ncbi:hypothetical protein LCGC14_2283000, partial [marine sediment metagenome]
FIHAAWAKVITSIALILGLLALFFIWSLLVAWIRGKAKWPLALTFAVIMIPILVLSFRPALVGEKSWILVLLPWGVILAIIAMFCLCGVLAPRIGRITTSGLYGLLFGMLLLAYNLMRNSGYSTRIWPARFITGIDPESGLDNFNGCLAPWITQKLANDATLLMTPTEPGRFDDRICWSVKPPMAAQGSPCSLCSIHPSVTPTGIP